MSEQAQTGAPKQEILPKIETIKDVLDAMKLIYKASSAYDVEMPIFSFHCEDGSQPEATRFMVTILIRPDFGDYLDGRNVESKSTPLFHLKTIINEDGETAVIEYKFNDYGKLEVDVKVGASPKSEAVAMDADIHQLYKILTDPRVIAEASMQIEFAKRSFKKQK